MLPLVAGQPLPSVSLYPSLGLLERLQKRGSGCAAVKLCVYWVGLLSVRHCLLAVDDVPRTMDMPLLTPCLTPTLAFLLFWERRGGGK